MDMLNYWQNKMCWLDYTYNVKIQLYSLIKLLNVIKANIYLDPVAILLLGVLTW